MTSICRIEVFAKVFDTRALVRKDKLLTLGFSHITDIWLADVYTLDRFFQESQLSQISRALVNPLTQSSVLRSEKATSENMVRKFDWVIEVGFLPGVTDNIASTVKEIIEDLLKIKFKNGEGIYTSQLTFIKGDLDRDDIEDISGNLHNPLIKRAYIKSYADYKKSGGMDLMVPKVTLTSSASDSTINLDISDSNLEKIGKEGIQNSDGTRRGPLALDLFYMKQIQKYFKYSGRNPTDVELESLAQTWSEHCKHTIFGDPIDEIKDGLFSHYIKKATEEIRKKKGKKDFCVSVFSDNSGAISFDGQNLITHKVETHNTPSSLDPFGGSITGIVGVNRDTIGFGLGARPVANFYGYCFADPRLDIPLYKDLKQKQRMLGSRRIMDGVTEGVSAGGNQSGIPTPQGFIYFDEKYRGKPLVFVGTVGLIPKKIKGKVMYKKKALPGDYIVMIGGRVGKDGIHGATFSSEALNEGSPVTAVQIGDPITQKKLSDCIVSEARDMFLYNSITDNGAGGLSCSVSEMAKESGGCIVNLEKVPLKYPDLSPWEIWISESQERMTLAVPAGKWRKFKNLLTRRGVEATVIGKFSSSGKCIVANKGKVIMDLDMQFLHYGLPKRYLKTDYKKLNTVKNKVTYPKDLTSLFISMMSRLNLASYEFITKQYDHIVQGNLALAPLQGKGRVNASATIIKPVMDSERGVVMSQGLYPRYSDIDAYKMAAAAIDTAVRNAVAVGADPQNLALLDNFCWCDSLNPYRLGQLKQAASACYDYATIYGTPFISGKDSMFNDFKGYDSRGKPIAISILPTLLITSVGIIKDVSKAVSLDAKKPQDLIYILGGTYDELGGSEFLAMYGEKTKKEIVNNTVPRTDAVKNKKLYQAYYKAIEKGMIVSSVSLGIGGLAASIAKTAMGGLLGLQIDLSQIPGRVSENVDALFSESQGRIIVTINPSDKKLFEKTLSGCSFAQIGEVTAKKSIIIKGLDNDTIVETTLEKVVNSYRNTFKGY